MLRINSLVKINGFDEPGRIIHILENKLYEIELIHGPIIITGESSIELVENNREENS